MRLVFIRALLHRPRLLFLDEPTSGMDPANARIVKDIIRELRAEGRTVFLTTHDMATADQLCDRVAFVVDGQIAALDSPTEHKIRRSQRHRARRPTAPATPRRSSTRTSRWTASPTTTTFRALVREQHVEAVHSQEASLEDVFIDVTGRTLRMSGVAARRRGVKLDFRLQRRYGFLYATAFVVLLWIGVVLLIPTPCSAPPCRTC